MKQGIYISIKKEHIDRIISGIKNYEFRKYIPKRGADILYVYVPSPVCELKYIIEVNNIISYPNKILKEGYGNKEFNEGLKKSKFAYEVSSVYELESTVKLSLLKDLYGFSAPQSYAYDDRYKELTEYINKMKKNKLVSVKSFGD